MILIGFSELQMFIIGDMLIYGSYNSPSLLIIKPYADCSLSLMDIELKKE